MPFLEPAAGALTVAVHPDPVKQRAPSPHRGDNRKLDTSVYIRYTIFMPKVAVSITLDDANLLWLRGRTAASKARSLSETIDDLVRQARAQGSVPAGSIRSVVGTVDIADADPNLDRADEFVRKLVDSSLSTPFLVRETAPIKKPSRSRSKSRG